jgi:hypothetical protein
MKLGVDFSILNQKGTPAFYSDIFANRPTYGFAGRVFISTDTGAIYEDTGTAWTLIADAGAGTTGTLQQVTTNGNTTAQGLVVTAGNVAIGTATAGAPLDIHGTGTIAQFNGTGTSNAYTFYQNAGTNKWRVGNLYNAGANSYEINDSASAVTRLSIRNTGEFAITGFESINNTPTFASSGNYASNPSLSLTIPVSSTFNSGASWSGMAASSLNTWGGNNTVGNGAVLAGFIGVSRQSFSSGGSTVTLTQGSNGIRAICGMQVLQQTGGSNNSTISHGASLLVQGVYPTAGANITYTNYYGLVINQLDEYGGVTFTNRWGIYQGGSTDKNYFNGNILVKSTTDNGSALQVTGAGTFTSDLSANGSLTINSSGNSFVNLGNTANYASISSGGGGVTFYMNGATRGGSGTASSGASVLAQDGDYYISNSAVNVNKFIVKSGGNVLIGTSTDSGIKLQVNGGIISLFGGSSGISFVDRTTTNILTWYASGGATFLNSDGLGNIAQINNANGVYTPLSDINKKKDFEQSTIGLNAILGLNPILYRMKSDNTQGNKELGFIAQEVKEFIPQAYVDNNGFIGLNDRPIIAVLVKAIQELNEKLVKNNIN